MLKFSTKLGVKLGVSSLAILILTACGGGGSDSSSTAPVAVNQAPVASAGSKLSIVTEGQPFTLDASGSTDANGDSLSFEWRQTAGPAVQIASPTNPTLELVAPMLDADDALSFELTVSDGEFSRSSSVSLEVEDLKVDAVISEATDFGTGGPATPIPVETTGDTSEFEGRKSLTQMIGLTPSNAGGYTVHWTALSAGTNMPVSSQNFTPEGEITGDQIDGVFRGGVFGEQFERNGLTLNRVRFGAPIATLLSGDTLYYLNVNLELAEEFAFELATHRGLVEGEVEGFGDTYLSRIGSFETIFAGDFITIGSNDLLSVTSEFKNDVLQLEATVIDELGRPEVHVLTEIPSSERDRDFHRLALTAYETESYLAVWSQESAESGYDIIMQRGDTGGLLLGIADTVNIEKAGDQLLPNAVTMTDGNIFVTWLSSETDTEGAKLRGRIVRPNGSFATEEVSLTPILPQFDPEDMANEFNYELTALNTNEVMISWRDETTGASQLKALVVDENFQVVSNPFVIATGEPAEFIERIFTVIMPDNRVIMGWANEFSVVGEILTGTSHTIGFYPVGKE